MKNTIRSKLRSRKFIVVLISLFFWLGLVVYYCIRNEQGSKADWVITILRIITDPIMIIVVGWMGVDTAGKMGIGKAIVSTITKKK